MRVEGKYKFWRVVMKMFDKNAFAKLLQEVAVLYRRRLTPSTIDFYFNDMLQYSLAEVEDALTKHRRDPDQGKFFPAISELLKHLGVRDADQMPKQGQCTGNKSYPLCPHEVIIKLGNSHFCEEHYDAIRVKTALQQETEDLADLLQDGAAKAGGNNELFCKEWLANGGMGKQQPEAIKRIFKILENKTPYMPEEEP